MTATILDPRIWPQQRIDKVLRVSERNEHWAELHEWREKIEVARRKGYPLPVGGALYKARFDEALGGLVAVAGASGWEIDDMPIVDFGAYTVAATTGSVRSGYNVFPLVNPFSALGTPDPEPFQEPGGTLLAITGDRQVGTGRLPLVVCAGCFAVHVTGAGAVFQPPATATLNLQVMSSNLATAGAYTTEGTLNLTTAANVIDQVPIVATATRGLTTPDAVVRTNVFLVFNGDHIVMNLTNTNAAALAVGGNTLFTMLELI
jgi:hypothetical protein